MKNNDNIGIYANFSIWCLVQNNSVSLNDEGAQLTASDEFTIRFNTFLNNTAYAVNLGIGSNGSVIHSNDFFYNNLGGTSQGYEAVPGNVWYLAATSIGNYWTDWVAGPYDIDGPTSAQDLYPQPSPIV